MRPEDTPVLSREMQGTFCLLQKDTEEISLELGPILHGRPFQ